MARASWRILEYAGPRALDHLDADWRRLYRETRLRTAYQSLALHRAYLDSLAASPDTFRCVVLSDGRRVRAICPLEARVENVMGLPIPTWGVPRHPHITASDVIGPEDDARRALLPALAAHLRRHPQGRPLLAVGPLPADSVLWQGVRQLPRHAYATGLTMPAAVFDCTLPFDELQARLSRHFRRNLRAHRRKLEGFGEVRTVTAAGDAFETEFRAFLDVESSGWKGRSGTRSAILLHPELTAFYRTVGRDLSCDGTSDRCEINSLYADGRCLASQLCFRTGSLYSIAKIAYGEQYSRLGPGLLLMQDTIERCCEDAGIEQLSLQTYGAWQSDWHPHAQLMQQAYVAIGGTSRLPTVAMLRFRYGPGRWMARRLRHELQKRRATLTSLAGSTS